MPVHGNRSSVQVKLFALPHSVCALALVGLSTTVSASDVDISDIDPRVELISEVVTRPIDPRQSAEALPIFLSIPITSDDVHAYVEVLGYADSTFAIAPLVQTPVPSIYSGVLPRLPAGRHRFRLTVDYGLQAGRYWSEQTAWLDEDTLELAWNFDSPGSLVVWRRGLGVPFLERMRVLLTFQKKVTYTAPRTGNVPPSFSVWSEACVAHPQIALAEMRASPRMRQHVSVYLAARIQCAIRAGAGELAWRYVSDANSANLSSDFVKQAVLDLVRRDIDHGRVERARLGLLRTRDIYSNESRWRHLSFFVAMRSGRVDDAIETLSIGGHLAPLALIEGTGSQVKRHAYMRINLAIANLKGGNPDVGLSLLDTVGRLDPIGRELTEIRDRANVLLGWTLLSKQEGAAAGLVFERMLALGTAGERGLLGLGWSYLSGAGGELIRAAVPVDAVELPKSLRVSIGLPALYKSGAITCEQYLALVSEAIAPCAATRVFPQIDWPASRKTRLLHAIGAWRKLTELHSVGLSSIEAYIAIADAHTELGAMLLARQELTKALETIATLKSEFSATSSLLAGGAATCAHWTNADAFLTHFSEYVQKQLISWLASAQQRTAFELRERIHSLLRSELIDKVTKEQLSAIYETISERICVAASDDLRIDIGLLERYELAARLRLARSFDTIDN